MAAGAALAGLALGEAGARARQPIELLGTADGLAAAGLPGAAELLAAGEPIDRDDPAELGEAAPLGASDAEGAGELLGDADGHEALGAGLGDGDGEGVADGISVGVGLGCNPTGSGPTKTNAARMPKATRTPTRNPARTVTPVFIAGEGTSTDGRGRRVLCHC